MMARSGYDLRDGYNMDGLAKFYIAINVLWTSILLCGVTCLVLLRNLTFIRIRNVALAASAVLSIHVYLVFVLMVYPLNGRYPCSFEYWIMSIYFPIGVALFQAQNVQLLDLSCLQKQLMVAPVMRPAKHMPARRGLAGWRDRWRQMSLVSRTYVCTGVGIIVQVGLPLCALSLSLSLQHWPGQASLFKG